MWCVINLISMVIAITLENSMSRIFPILYKIHLIR